VFYINFCNETAQKAVDKEDQEKCNIFYMTFVFVIQETVLSEIISDSCSLEATANSP
jgi:hypothetical protein